LAPECYLHFGSPYAEVIPQIAFAPVSVHSCNFQYSS
jgi:hypothetical protein